MKNSNFMKMPESSPNRQKTLWEKEKLLIKCFQKNCTADMLKPVIVWERVNPLLNDQIWHVPKFKAFADELYVNMKISFFDRVENSGKRRKCW